MLAIGLMSGTSLDGVDAVLCEITGVDETTQIKQIDFICVPFKLALKEKLLNLLENHHTTTRFISSLNFELGYAFADVVKELLKRNHLKSSDVSFVSSHGQTIYHLPNPIQGEFASTLQLGEAAVIAYECGIQVVSNFRVMDMAAGGQGAPLVPFSESILYGQTSERTVLLNLGGIANITVLDEKILAFDTGPANMMIDEAMRIFYKKEYDENAEVAQTGMINDALFDVLKSHPYLTFNYPKTTGREDFGAEYVQSILEDFKLLDSQDIIRTLTYFTSYCVAKALSDVGGTFDRLIVSGGGAYNPLILKDLADLCDVKDVLTQEDLGYSSASKEAIAFVICGNQTLHHKPSNVPSVTGAQKNLVLGSITAIPY